MEKVSGDSERKLLLLVREQRPIRGVVSKFLVTGERIKFELEGGDMYIMSEKSGLIGKAWSKNSTSWE